MPFGGRLVWAQGILYIGWGADGSSPACWEGQSLLFRLSRDPELFGAKLGWTMAPLPRPLKSAYETGFMSLPHEKGNFMEIFAWRQIRVSTKVDALRRWVCGGDASF